MLISHAQLQLSCSGCACCLHMSFLDALVNSETSNCRRHMQFFLVSAIKSVATYSIPFMFSMYFHEGACKWDVIQLGACIYRTLTFCGCLLSQFYGIMQKYVFACPRNFYQPKCTFGWFLRLLFLY